MWGDEDRRRLLESAHDIHAAKNTSAISSHAAFQAAVTASHDELVDARAGLKQTLVDHSRELSETDAKRQDLERSCGVMVRRYGFIRGKVNDALLNVDPDAPVDPPSTPTKAFVASVSSDACSRSRCLTSKALGPPAVSRWSELLSPRSKPKPISLH